MGERARFCTNCGRPIEPGAMFCAHCGHARFVSHGLRRVLASLGRELLRGRFLRQKRPFARARRV